MPLTERTVQALLQVWLGQDPDRQDGGDAHRAHDLVLARENGARCGWSTSPAASSP